MSFLWAKYNCSYAGYRGRKIFRVKYFEEVAYPRKYYTLKSIINEIFSVKNFRTMAYCYRMVVSSDAHVNMCKPVSPHGTCLWFYLMSHTNLFYHYTHGL